MEMYARKIHAMPMTSGTVAMTFAGKVKMTRNSVPTMRITCRVGEVRLLILLRPPFYSSFPEKKLPCIVHFYELHCDFYAQQAGYDQETLNGTMVRNVTKKRAKT